MSFQSHQALLSGLTVEMRASLLQRFDSRSEINLLAFSKEGYASGSTPVDIKPDEAPGGSISFELGGLSRDNVELRNGTVLNGDVISMSMTDVVVRVDGKDLTRFTQSG